MEDCLPLFSASHTASDRHHIRALLCCCMDSSTTSNRTYSTLICAKSCTGSHASSYSRLRQWLYRIVGGRSPASSQRKPRVSSNVIHVRSVADKVTLGQVSLSSCFALPVNYQSNDSPHSFTCHPVLVWQVHTQPWHQRTTSSKTGRFNTMRLSHVTHNDHCENVFT